MVISIPYKKRELKNMFNSALSFVQKIKMTTNVNDEMVYWVNLVETIIDSGTINDDLDRLRSVITGKINYLDADILAAEGKEALDNIVIPFIKHK